MVAIVTVKEFTPLVELAPTEYERAVSPFVLPVGRVFAVLTGIGRLTGLLSLWDSYSFSHCQS